MNVLRRPANPPSPSRLRARAAGRLPSYARARDDHTDRLVLGSTADCRVQGFVRFRPDRAPSSDVSSVELRDLAIFAVQGHPEFEPDVVLKIIECLVRLLSFF